MLELVGRPAFLRFLFTFAQKAGIGASSLGNGLDASTNEGRRALGLDILNMADRALPGRVPSMEPFSVLGAAIAAMQEVQQAEGDDNAEDNGDEFDRR